MKSGPRPLPVFPGTLCKLEISRLGHGGEDRSQGSYRSWVHCLFKGTPLGDWSPSSSVQHHMIPDSDGDAHERVYHLTFFHILYSLLPSPPTCRRNGQASLCSWTWAQLSHVPYVSWRAHFPIQVLLVQCSPHALLVQSLFQAPHSYILHMESGKCLDSALLPRSLPGGPASQGGSPATGPPQSPWSWASWPEWWGLALGHSWLGVRTHLSKRHLSCCSRFFPFVPFDAEREKIRA